MEEQEQTQTKDKLSVSFTLKGELKDNFQKLMEKQQLNATSIAKVAIIQYISRELNK